MKTIFLFLFLLICTLTASCNFSVSTGSNKNRFVGTPGTAAQNLEAFEAASGIVHTLDDGRYEQAWEDSSQLLKNVTPKATLTNVLSLMRKNLGAPNLRSTAAIGFLEKIDDTHPKGEYSVVELNTTFGKYVTHEKIVMVKESGAWKLAGYFLDVLQ